MKQFTLPVTMQKVQQINMSTSLLCKSFYVSIEQRLSKVKIDFRIQQIIIFFSFIVSVIFAIILLRRLQPINESKII